MMVKMYTIPGSDLTWKGILIAGLAAGFSMIASAGNAVAEDSRNMPQQSSYAHPKVVNANPNTNIQPKSLIARKHYSNNYTQGRKKAIDTIVLHTTEGSGQGAEDWLTRPQSRASAHYLILESGEIVQLVNESDTAWHCRKYNSNSIGIELAGRYNQDLGEKQVTQAANLIKNIRQRQGNLLIKPHSELDPARRKDPGKKNLERILVALQ